MKNKLQVMDDCAELIGTWALIITKRSIRQVDVWEACCSCCRRIVATLVYEEEVEE